MFRLIRFQDEKVKPALSKWLFMVGGEYKCHWPLSGLIFKLKNFVSPPNELNVQERKNWKVLSCEIAVSGKD